MDLTKMKPAAKATKEAKFRFVFSQRSAMRLKRLSFPTATVQAKSISEVRCRTTVGDPLKRLLCQ
jgi:hypothetical protein